MSVLCTSMYHIIVTKVVKKYQHKGFGGFCVSNLKISDILPKAVKSMSSKFSKMFSIEAVNLLKVEESIISGEENKQ